MRENWAEEDGCWKGEKAEREEGEVCHSDRRELQGTPVGEQRALGAESQNSRETTRMQEHALVTRGQELGTHGMRDGCIVQRAGHADR